MNIGMCLGGGVHSESYTALFKINYPISVDLERTGTETQPKVDVPDF